MPPTSAKPTIRGSYLAFYFQDDIKLSPVPSPSTWASVGITSAPSQRRMARQANFVQSGPPTGGPIYLIPATGKANRQLSSTANNPSLNGQGFLDLLAKDGIALGSTNKYGNALVQTQQNNFAPRFGFAYQATPKLVVRGGFGLFYNSFENQGYGPNIGENYPFVYNFNFKGNGSDSCALQCWPQPIRHMRNGWCRRQRTNRYWSHLRCLYSSGGKRRRLEPAGASIRLPDASYFKHEPHSPICVDEHHVCAGGIRLH